MSEFLFSLPLDPVVRRPDGQGQGGARGDERGLHQGEAGAALAAAAGEAAERAAAGPSCALQGAAVGALQELRRDAEEHGGLRGELWTL